MTEPETRLWLALRGRRLDGVKFSRQVVAGPYILDFCARTLKLAIEVDGDTHADQSRDDRRTAWLKARGYRVMRFTNADVMMNLDGVLQTILSAVTTGPRPPPLPRGGWGARAWPRGGPPGLATPTRPTPKAAP
ncbi:MAG: endonuclease domain-containing protein, partial [Pseudomonadota bacterium]|nr:endonuclease domain-containing protein [Pseudomonadota bacterium]